MAGAISGSALRTLCTACALTTAVVLLGWTYTEQNAVRRCVAAQRARADSVPPAQQQSPIHLVVQLPKENKTQNPPKNKDKWNYHWDRRAWGSPDEATGVPTRTLILVRHGQYDLQTGHLTELGRKQANLTGERLSRLFGSYDVLIHSTLDRAVETAHAIQPHLKFSRIMSDDVLQEGGPLPPDPTVSYWSLPEVAYHTDGPRLEAAFRKYFYRAGKQQQAPTHDILVGHGNIFRFMVLRALQLPPEAWMRIFIAHASITMLHVNPDGTVNMDKFGDSGHLPSEFVTY